MRSNRDEILFEAICFHFNKEIRITIEYWSKIINEKHPSIRGDEDRVVLTLQNPDEIRQSKKYEDVFYITNYLRRNIFVLL